MSTKYISVNGFGKIDCVDKSIGESKKSNIVFRKLIRFIKRAFKEIRKDAKTVKKKISDITWSTLTPKKFFMGLRKFHIKGSYFESLRTPKGIATLMAPVFAAVLLVLTICFWTCSDKPLTVSVNGEFIASIENEAVLTQASASLHNALSDTEADEGLNPVLQISYPSLLSVEKSNASDVYEKLVDCNDAVVSNAGGLYVDGVFYGAAEDASALSDALTSVLSAAKANYDNTTVTTFNNDVQVVTDVYPASSIKTVEEIISEAQYSFSIRLETDLVVENEVAFDTIYEYDDNQLDTYELVKSEGKNGKEKVFYRLTYIDGMLTDSAVVSATVTEEAQAEIKVVGTQESYTGSGDFIWPVPSTGLCTSPFEYRWGSFHEGIDIAGAAYGADIIASDSGEVVWAGMDSTGYGNYIIIDHGNGYSTMYAHCSDLYVSVGDKVLRGDIIAGVGATGYVTGVHLHFEIWENGTPIDPLQFMTPDVIDTSF